MGRGLAYEISDDPKALDSMDTDSIELNAQALEIDYCGTMDAEAKAKAQKKLCDLFKSKGATVSKEGKIPSISGVTAAVKENYFRERYEKMKKLAAGITLEAFSSDPYDASLYNLTNTIYQQWSDVVYFNGVIYNMDTFVRNMQADKTYFLGNIIHMH